MNLQKAGIPKENVDFKKKKTLQEKERNFLMLTEAML